MLKGIERKMAKSTKNISEDDYFENLIDGGLKPKTKMTTTISSEVQEVAIETLKQFARNAQLEYAYQMLLLLTMLTRTNHNGFLSIKETIDCFLAFYNLRSNAG